MKTERRRLFGVLAGGGAALAVPGIIHADELTREEVRDDLLEAESISPEGAQQLRTIEGIEEAVPEPIEQEPIERLELLIHTERIAGEKESVLQVVWDHKLMVGVRGLSREQVYSDLRKYFDVYKGAEIKYQVHWFLLWDTHTKETTSSRNPNPGAAGYKGCMQRNPWFYTDSYVREAIRGWEFLGLVASGYGDFGNRFGFHDYEEIFGAARKISEDSWSMYRKVFIELNNNERPNVLSRYCSPENALNRAATCNYVAPYMGVALKL